MAYIGASIAVDRRGKILIGQQAAELFDPVALKGFFAHEMAHLVSDNAAVGCNDYVLRDPQIEAELMHLPRERLESGLWRRS